MPIENTKPKSKLYFGAFTLIFISDNNGFDWIFVCWYFYHFIGENPFGYSFRRLADLYCGSEKDTFAQ
jgi:hypothetical protein